jgi:hypothetical protein
MLGETAAAMEEVRGYGLENEEPEKEWYKQ